MTSQQSYSALVDINQNMTAALKQMQQAFNSDLDESEKLVQTLQNLLQQRQKLLAAWLSDTTVEDLNLLQQQQKLTQDYERQMLAFRKYYEDNLVVRKRNERKLDLYKTLDAQR